MRSHLITFIAFKIKFKLKTLLCDPMDYIAHGILQARILECVPFPSPGGSSQLRDWTQVSHIAGGFFTSWATRETQEYRSGLPCPPPGNLPNPGIKPRFLTLQVDFLPAEPPGKPKNTGVGSISLLQGIFPIQESNQDLLYCRQILYQLSYQGSPQWSYFKSQMVMLLKCCP